MSTFSLKITFNDSRSKNFDSALAMASKFEHFSRQDVNVVDVTMKEIFEKWDYFNLLFWSVVDWKGSILEYDGNAFQSHNDKTRLFYALQHAHTSYICYLEDRIRELHQVQLGLMSYEELDELYSEEDMNALLDCFQIVKNHKEAGEMPHPEIKIRERQSFLKK